ncbi:HAD family hydrolase [Oxynema sp. CENA135]|jgi:HAD superfamily hydrolase (TIGR01509 family)|uniref:HAD family hydrolase n=1 Tax=Oxynema sp. CENA135 TaxID=984206 RepID=UPI0019096E62|nr:HAD family hydrolase [Oxynema sp. CENA135]MBK4731837.1 HAD family hydrolase [Oxynema sp. CENA135]
MSELKALIFDVDGTIAETERDGHRVAFNRAFADAGLEWHWTVELYGQLLEVAGGKERIAFYLQEYQPPFREPEDRDRWIAELHAIKTEHFRALSASGQIPLRPGVRRLLEEAKQQGIRLAIATTSAPENAIALIEHAIAPDSPQWFEAIAAGDIVERKKPAPDIYDYVLEQMDLAPESCLVIEDSPQGLTAATGAGLNTVITVNNYTARYPFPKAALTIDHLGEPDNPFTVLAGEVGNSTYFDMALAREVHRQASEAQT